MKPEIPESVGLIDQRERERFFDAIALAAERLSAARPTVMIFEDLHWVFADTLDLITRIARTCARSPFLTIVSFREEQMTSALQSFRSDPAMKWALRLGLGRLDATACRKIVQDYKAVSPAFGSRAIDLANGNPLFLSELVREYGARSECNDDEPGEIPATLESTINARVAMLSEAARSLIDIAAVGGTIVSIDVLQHASGWPLAEVLDAADELVDRFVLRETAAGSRGDYQFTHDLIRATVLQSMPADVERRRHRRFAKAILQLFPDRQDEFARVLAQHFERAGRTDEAARYYARAASVARGQYAWQDAIAFADHALRLEQRLPERFALYAAIESAALTCGDGQRQHDAAAMMLALANDLDDDALRAIALQRSSEFGLQTGDFERQRHATDELERIALASGDASMMAKTLRCRARGDIARGYPASAARTMHNIDAIDGLARTPSERFDDLRTVAHALTAAADFEPAQTVIREAERQAGADPSLADQLAIVRAQAMLAVEMADRGEAARLSPALLELCRKIGDVEGEGNAHQVAARIDWWSFDVASAREHIRAAAAIFERIGKPQSRASIAINAGALENHVGLLDDAEHYYREALAHVLRLDNALGRSLCHANFAYVALLRRDGERALAEAQRALEIARNIPDQRMIATALGHSASALRLLDRDPGESLRLFTEALAICAAPGFADERRELIAEMIPTLIACGKRDQAGEFAAELDAAISIDENAVVMPADALAKAADGFAAIGRTAKSNALRERAGALVRARLEKLPDARTRAAYAALHAHRALLAREDYECA